MVFSSNSSISKVGGSGIQGHPQTGLHETKPKNEQFNSNNTATSSLLFTIYLLFTLYKKKKKSMQMQKAETDACGADKIIRKVW